MFTSYPTYSRYRTISYRTPMLFGEDVFALQNALKSCGFDAGGWDGYCGKLTGAAIRSFQHASGLVVDGLAGGATQQELALALAKTATQKYSVAPGALKGQIEHESGYRLGNYSEIRADGSYDAGVVQRNTAHLQSVQSAFMVRDSIMLLAQTVRSFYDKFDKLPERRRWSLAQGAWNAPAFACYIAREEGAPVAQALTARPSSAARETLEEYISDVTIYLNP